MVKTTVRRITVVKAIQVLDKNDIVAKYCVFIFRSRILSPWGNLRGIELKMCV